MHRSSPLMPDSRVLPCGRNCIDGLELLKAIQDESIAAAFFDPQYRGVLNKLSYGNEGVTRGTRRAQLPQMEECDICAFLMELDRVLFKSAHLFLWVDKFHLCEGVPPWLKDTALETVDMIVWDKARIGMGYRTRRTSEYLLVLQKRPKRAKGVWRDHTLPDVWREPASRRHPHSKPVSLQARLIEAVTAEGDWVLDPSAGSYSVLEACTAVGRNFIGGDLLPYEESKKIMPAVKR